jgi:hypothetical protein
MYRALSGQGVKVPSGFAIVLWGRNTANIEAIVSGFFALSSKMSMCGRGKYTLARNPHFEDYTLPHKNVSVMFLRAYRAATTDRNVLLH